EADFAGDYWYSATLVAGDEDIDSLNGTLSLDRGRNQVLLRFDATAIGMRRLDGPYQVVLRMFGPTEAAGLSARFKTQPFTANQFEGFIPDTTPPEVWGWVRPTILWPPDHRMVEIDVGYGASDDRDIRPSIALESIVASEGENALGDGNTSPDIVVEGHRVFLRAERSGTGSDRVYTFTFVARDRAGNTARMTAAVRVPHDGGGQ
ncbi:MAG TPA: hypothetical protein VNA04_17440, partial [Thermoanaerobaculia bacterium]|nr:hypothetical protein [Thermoanaerobaculia bacterium]